ncbi:MAG TPA: hypothetical protein VE269_07640 [Gaiellaceae bacterium]|nr:hypothetical protein [Gaiellaceae bacterium]
MQPRRPRDERDREAAGDEEDRIGDLEAAGELREQRDRQQQQHEELDVVHRPGATRRPGRAHGAQAAGAPPSEPPSGVG